MGVERGERRVLSAPLRGGAARPQPRQPRRPRGSEKGDEVLAGYGSGRLPRGRHHLHQQARGAAQRLPHPRHARHGALFPRPQHPQVSPGIQAGGEELRCLPARRGAHDDPEKRPQIHHRGQGSAARHDVSVPAHGGGLLHDQLSQDEVQPPQAQEGVPQLAAQAVRHRVEHQLSRKSRSAPRHLPLRQREVSRGERQGSRHPLHIHVRHPLRLSGAGDRHAGLSFQELGRLCGCRHFLRQGHHGEDAPLLRQEGVRELRLRRPRQCAHLHAMVRGRECGLHDGDAVVPRQPQL